MDNYIEAQVQALRDVINGVSTQVKSGITATLTIIKFAVVAACFTQITYTKANIYPERPIISGECAFVCLTTEDGYDIFNTSDYGCYRLADNQVYLMIKN